MRFLCLLRFENHSDKIEKKLATKLENLVTLLKCILHQSSPVGRRREKKKGQGERKKQISFIEYPLKVVNMLDVFICLF